MNGVVLGDASAALAIVARRGLGTLRHLDTNYLWIQEKAAKGDLNFKKVAGVDNGADLFTKTLSWNEIQGHIHKLSRRVLFLSSLQIHIIPVPVSYFPVVHEAMDGLYLWCIRSPSNCTGPPVIACLASTSVLVPLRQLEGFQPAWFIYESLPEKGCSGSDARWMIVILGLMAWRRHSAVVEWLTFMTNLGSPSRPLSYGLAVTRMSSLHRADDDPSLGDRMHQYQTTQH